MPKPLDGPLTRELLVEETRFLLKTLLRDDLFGEDVSLTEAEKLMEGSLSIGFVDYAAFLKKRDYVVIDRTRNIIKVTPKGRNISEGMDDAEFHRELSAHFSSRLSAGASLPPLTASGRTASSTAMRTSGVAGHALTASMSPAALDELRDGRYSRGEMLGQGGVATVFAGRNIYLNRDVVLKEFGHVFDYLTFLQRDDVLRQLRAAVMSQAGLSHPHILEVLDLNFDKDPPYVVLPLAPGGNLASRVERARSLPDGVLPMPVASRALLQMAYAMHHAHTKEVLHLDLRPENVLFDRAGNVHMADFGLARAVEKAPGQGPPVYVGLGNPAFMAPEQVHGAAQMNQTTDIYAFGILMYFMLTGTLPGRRSPLPSEVNKACPKALDVLFDQMTFDRMDQRVATFSDVLDGLYEALPAQDVLTRGTLLLFETDPFPPPAEVAPSNGQADKTAAAPATPAGTDAGAEPGA